MVERGYQKISEGIGGVMDGLSAIGYVTLCVLCLAELMFMGYCAFVGASELRRRQEIGRKAVERVESMIP